MSEPTAPPDNLQNQLARLLAVVHELTDALTRTEEQLRQAQALGESLPVVPKLLVASAADNPPLRPAGFVARLQQLQAESRELYEQVHRHTAAVNADLTRSDHLAREADELIRRVGQMQPIADPRGEVDRVIGAVEQLAQEVPELQKQIDRHQQELTRLRERLERLGAG